MTLAELEALRASIPDDGNLPASTTRDELAAIQQRRAALDRRLTQVRDALATLASLGGDEQDERWRDQLVAWRAELNAHLLRLKPTIRDPGTLGAAKNLTLSIEAIDYGLGVFKDTGWELENSRLGELMIAAGFGLAGAEAARNFGGELPWFGSIKEVERRLADRAVGRSRAQAALDGALMDDNESARRAADSKALRDAFNAMDVKVGQDGTLVAYSGDGAVLDTHDMTPLQREAFERMAALNRPVAAS